MTITEIEFQGFNAYQHQANAFINEKRYKDKNDYLINTALGLTGEAGEFADLIKKILFHGHPFTEEVKQKLALELGDVLWYVSQGCRALNTSMTIIANMNIQKLRKRHDGKVFSEQASLNKELNKEQEIDTGDNLSGASNRTDMMMTNSWLTLFTRALEKGSDFSVSEFWKTIPEGVDRQDPRVIDAVDKIEMDILLREKNP